MVTRALNFRKFRFRQMLYLLEYAKDIYLGSFGLFSPEEWVALALVSDAGGRAVSGQDLGVVGQGQ